MPEDFNFYMERFKKNSLKEKQKIIYNQLKMLTALTNNLCKNLNIPNNIILNKELLDLEKENYTEDDFAEAIIVYINSIQNSICDYSLEVSKILNTNN